MRASSIQSRSPKDTKPQTLAMDIRITYKDAKIGFVFVRRGIVPEATSTYLLPRLIGHSRTMTLFLTGKVYQASSPLLSLLYSEILDAPEQVLPAAMELAREIATKTSAVSAAFAKALVWHGTPSAEEQHLLDSKAMFGMFFFNRCWRVIYSTEFICL